MYPEDSPTADMAGGLNYYLDCGDPAGHEVAELIDEPAVGSAA